MDADLINAGKDRDGQAGAVFLLGGLFRDDPRPRRSVLGAMQVDQEGSIANYSPGKMVKGMGGAMDLVAGARRLVVPMEHTARSGEPKILKACTLPLTGERCVHRIITDLCVFDVDSERRELVLVELAPDVTVEEIRAKTEAAFRVSPNLRPMDA